MVLERLQECDDLFLLDTHLVQSEKTAGRRQPGAVRYVYPVKVKLEDGCAPTECPRTYQDRALADTELVYEDYLVSFPLGFFETGQVLRF